MEQPSIRSAITRDIVNLCGLILVCALLSGLLIPTFSLFARELGASLVLVGALNSAIGLTTGLCSVPLGILSDRLGRRRMLLTGMLTWVLAQFILAAAPSPAVLFLACIFLGPAHFLTFSIGAAMIGDLITGRARGYAFGFYSTVQGVGYTLGPLAGGLMSEQYGIRLTYATTGLLALAGLLFGWRTLPDSGQRARRHAAAFRSTLGQLTVVARNPFIAIACLGALLVFLGYSGAVTSFFPLYADKLLLSQAAIGSMFALRGVSSTLSRLPLGALSARRSSFVVYAGSLSVSALALLGIAGAQDYELLLLFLLIEGAAFGGVFTVSQAFLNEHTTDQNRGTAVGLFQMAAGLGSTTGALLLGAVASRLGIAAVFAVTSIVVLTGVAVMIAAYAHFSRRATAPAARPSEDTTMRPRQS